MKHNTIIYPVTPNNSYNHNLISFLGNQPNTVNFDIETKNEYVEGCLMEVKTPVHYLDENVPPQLGYLRLKDISLVNYQLHLLEDFDGKNIEMKVILDNLWVKFEVLEENKHTVRENITLNLPIGLSGFSYVHTNVSDLEELELEFKNSITNILSEIIYNTFIKENNKFTIEFLHLPSNEFEFIELIDSKEEFVEKLTSMLNFNFKY